MKQSTIFISTILFLSSCALGIDPNTLSTPSTPSSFVLLKNIKFKEHRGLSEFEITIQSGEYHAVKRNEYGVFNNGPKNNYFLNF